MNLDTMSAQEAVVRLAQAEAELQSAFLAFAGWACQKIAEAEGVPIADLASEVRGLAVMAGIELGKLTGEAPVENGFLIGLARGMEGGRAGPLLRMVE